MKEYAKGVHELGDGVYAYLQPYGGWGLSNASLVTAGGTSLLVDTFFGPAWREFVSEAFSPFDFSGIEMRLPSHPFDGRLDIKIGDREVELVQVGPAHTTGDALVHVPDANVVFTGDILFIGGTPIMWNGSVDSILAACDRILEFGARTLVPGHGPITDASGVDDIKRYWNYVRDESRARFDAGMTADEAADDIDIADFRDWGESERIAVNVAQVYREFDPSLPAAPLSELLVKMVGYRTRH